MSEKYPVRQLNAEVARKIAAGEVIDRPNAIVRELMDNAIDSGANRITVEIEGGGIEKIRIVDNGSGMTKEDLSACARPHATSKISTEMDLLNLSTLGFRGEALASIAAVCRLSIISGGNKMRASITEDHIIEPAAQLEGTIVCAEGLFENFPARRQFLKRPSSEGVMCKNTFIEKVLPQPEKSFRLIQDGDIKLDLPAGQSLTERFVKAMEIRESSSLFSEISGQSSGSNPDWSFKIVIGEPGVFRSNKKDIYIFVNNRRIQEYALVQAIEYGCQGYFPNGNFPVAAAFITVNPSLVDFNIHPAKKEARFKDITSLHHGISTAVKSYFAEYTNSTMKKVANPESDVFSRSDLFTAAELAARAMDATSSKNKNRYGKIADFPDSFASTYKTAPQSSYFGGTGASNLANQSKSAAWNGFASKQTISPDYKIRHNKMSFFDLPKTPAELLKENGYSIDSKSKNAENRNDSQESISNQTEISTSSLVKSKQQSQGQEQIQSQSLELLLKKSHADKIRLKMDEIINSYSKNRSAQGTPGKMETQTDFSKAKKTEEKQTDLHKNNEISANSVQMLAEQALGQQKDDFHFIGSALGTFIIAEKSNTLFIIDKHAAHERMIFDQIMQNQTAHQSLLIPYVITTENQDDDDYLESIKDELKKIGFECENKGNGRWEFSTIHERWNGTEETLYHALLDKKVQPKDLIYSIAAMTACKAAVKDGYILDDSAAEEIARGALNLPDPHCPHGRPCFTTITRENLFSLVRRTDRNF